MSRFYAAILAAGSSQLFWYLSLPVITRIYSPAAVGMYGLFIAITGFVGLVIGARADLALLGASDRDFHVVRSVHKKLAFILWVPASLTTIVMVAAFGWPFDSMWMAAASIVSSYFVFLFTTDGASLIKLQDYNSLKVSAFARSFVQLIFQFAFFVFGAMGLALGKIIADLGGAFLREKSIRGGYSLLSVVQISWFTKEEKEVLLGNKEKYYYSLPQALVNAVSQYLPFYIIPIYCSSSFLGFYTIAFMLAVVPVGLIGTPIRQILLRDFADRSAVSGARQAASRASIILLIAGCAGWLLVYAIGESALVLLLGNDWGDVYPFLLLLLGWSVFGVASLPAVAYLLSQDGNRQHLVYESILMAGRALSLVIGFKFISGHHALVPFIVWNAVAISLFMIWVIFSFRGRQGHEYV